MPGSVTPAKMTIERRALAIAELCSSIQFAGDPQGRRDAIHKAALMHLRAVAGVEAAPGTDDHFYEDEGLDD